MLLELFLAFIGLSLVLIWLGINRPEHSELSIIGFLFLFLLSMNFLSGSVQYQTGQNTTTTYTYDPDSANLTSTFATEVYNYDTFDSGGILSHTVGYYLAVAAFIGFIGSLLAVGRSSRL